MNRVRIQQILKAASSKCLLVIGDVMLDEFVWGKVSRISPEAPVPVVEVSREDSYPGGAANVARNLVEFTKSVRVVGMVGRDGFGSDLAALLASEGIGTDCLIEAADVRTIVKTRIIARQQQVVRVDRETRRQLSPERQREVIERVRAVLHEVDAVVFEDYGKGLITQDLASGVLRMAAEREVVVTVDPNPGNLLDWSGATAIKPNRAEAFAAAGVPAGEPSDDPLQDEVLIDVGTTLLAKWSTKQLLITLGEHGMLLFAEGEEPYHTPTKAQEVFDVSGAGDTAISLYTLALCAGATAREAAEISNHASGIVVGKLGTATVTAEELVESFPA
jgi:rfaE bifunctional protein kinase chain/domain